MKKILWVLLLVITTQVNAQLNLLRFATFYASYSTTTPAAEPTSYRVEGTEPDNTFDFVPNFTDGELVEITQYSDPNLVITLGLRKIARFDYQVKGNNFYTGEEHAITDYSTISNAPGLEYLFQYSFVRNRGTEVTQQEYKIRYISNNYTAKASYVDDGLINLKYTLGEARLRKSFGSLDVTAGIAHRSHPVYGCNPIDDVEATSWEEFAFSQDYFRFNDGIWLRYDDDAEAIEWLAASDNEFYKYHFGRLVTDYNQKILKDLGIQQEASLVLGLDYYYNTEDCWLHTWGSVYPVHKGLTEFSFVRDGNNVEWDTGLIFGVNFSRHFSVFVEGRHLKFWDRPSYQLKTGINYLIF
mgnify:FL=1